MPTRQPLLALDYHFEVLARQYQYLVARAVALLHERQQVLGQRNLLLGRQRAVSPVDRTVVRLEDLEPMGRRAVAERELAAGGAYLQRGAVEQLFEPGLGAPCGRRLKPRRRG